MKTVYSLAAILLFVVLVMQTSAQFSTTRIEVSKLGPQVGERVPDFNLKDQNGKSWNLQSLIGPKGLMLVFVRSADWCPYCKTQLLEMQGRVGEIRGRGLGLAESTRKRSCFTKARVGSVFASLILNPEWALGSDPEVQTVFRLVGIAFPGTFILDREGRVTSRFFEDFYIERNTVSGILLKLDDNAPAVAGTEISTAHFDLTTYPSDSAVAAGNRFNFRPRPRMHIYAPRAQNYRAISLKLDPHPWVQVVPMKYPPSEIYEFKPLNEKVPVYQKPFLLVQELVLSGTPQAQAAYRGQESITLTGSLEYQACDDTICYSPASVPLSWTLKLRSLVTGRTNRVP